MVKCLSHLILLFPFFTCEKLTGACRKGWDEITALSGAGCPRSFPGRLPWWQCSRWGLGPLGTEAGCAAREAGQPGARPGVQGPLCMHFRMARSVPFLTPAALLGDITSPHVLCGPGSSSALCTPPPTPRTATQMIFPNFRSDHVTSLLRILQCLPLSFR